MPVSTCFLCTGVLPHITLGNDPWRLFPALYPIGGSFLTPGGKSNIWFWLQGLSFTLYIPLRSPKSLMGKIPFTAFARLLVRQMECSEHWCEQNDDTTISIIALACACVISIDFNGLCEEEDKSSYHWARHLGWWYTTLLRFRKSL